MLSCLLVLWLAAPPDPGPPAASPPAPRAAPELVRSRRVQRPSRSRGGLRTYLSRPVPNSARFLDHGVLGVGVAGGVPHFYRFEATLGLLDHVTAGVTTHWLPGQVRPRLAPIVTLAFWRGRVVEVGASYRQVLHRPPEAPLPSGQELGEDERAPLTYAQRTHYGMAVLTFNRGLASLGLDLGAAHLRQPHPDPEASPAAFENRLVAAGGLHLRIGTRRWGFTAQTLVAPAPVPQVTAELVFEVRPGLFELRPRGGWRSF